MKFKLYMDPMAIDIKTPPKLLAKAAKRSMEVQARHLDSDFELWGKMSGFQSIIPDFNSLYNCGIFGNGLMKLNLEKSRIYFKDQHILFSGFVPLKDNRHVFVAGELWPI